MPDMSEVQHRAKSDEPGINRGQHLSAPHAAWQCRVLIPRLLSLRPTNTHQAWTLIWCPELCISGGYLDKGQQICFVWLQRAKEEFRKVVTSLLIENGQLPSLQCMCNGDSCGISCWSRYPVLIQHTRMADGILLSEGVDGQMYGNKKGSIGRVFNHD